MITVVTAIAVNGDGEAASYSVWPFSGKSDIEEMKQEAKELACEHLHEEIGGQAICVVYHVDKFELPEIPSVTVDKEHAIDGDGFTII